jgi:hypothetical protein
MASRGYLTVMPSYRLSTIRWFDFFVYMLLICTSLTCIILGTSLGLSSPPTATLSWVLPVAFFLPLVVAITYKILREGGCRGGMALHPDHIMDVATALKWTQGNIELYGGDANDIVLSGHSAGAHIASMLAVQPSFLNDVDRLGLVGAKPTVVLPPGALRVSQSSTAAIVGNVAISEGGGEGTTTLSSTCARSGSSSSSSFPVSALILFSGVYDADFVSMRDWLAHGVYFWMWPWAWARRSCLMHPAFGYNVDEWKAAFPTGLCKDADYVASLKLPPIMLINSALDLGLSATTDIFQRQLAAGGTIVERYTFGAPCGRGIVDHNTWVICVGISGSAANEIILPLLLSYLARVRPRRDTVAKDYV